VTPRASSAPTTTFPNASGDAPPPGVSPVFRAWLDSAEPDAPTGSRLSRTPIALAGAGQIGVWISSRSAN
jgi:hypothetical protein